MNLLRKNFKRTTALAVAISMTGGVAFALKSKHDKIKTSDTVINNVGKIPNPKIPTSADDPWTGNYIYFGHYPQSSDGNGGYNDEPIKWRVLDNDNVAWDDSKSVEGNGFNYNKSVSGYPTTADKSYVRQNAPIGGNGMLLLTDKVIDAKQYHPTYNSGNENYELCWGSKNSILGLNGEKNGCTLWAWLNDYDNSKVWGSAVIPEKPFISNAFNNKERSYILTSAVYSEDMSTGTEQYASSPRTSLSKDKIFIPSVAEVKCFKYGFGLKNQNGGAPISSLTVFNPTDYAKSLHKQVTGYSPYVKLRTPYTNSTTTSQAWIGCIYGSGFIAGSVVNTSACAMLPAMNLDISKILFVSKSDESNKPSETSSVPTAFAMPTGYGNEYKLTMKNNDIGFEIDRSSFVQNGSDFTFRYNNATAGANNYISCIIEQKEDASYVKYYGKLAKAKSSDTVTVRIPADVVDGAYQIKFFAEECNGEKETDYASEPVVLRVNNEGKVEGTYETTYADVESIEIQPQSHSASGDGPADQTTVILRGKNFSSDYKVTIEFRIDGENNPVLSYPTNGKAFSDTNDTTLTINIPKSEMEKLNEHVGRYTVEAKVETN